MKPALDLAPRWRSLAAAMTAAARWRGNDPAAVSLGTWLALAAGLAVIAWLLAPLEPVLQLAPPFLAAAALWPAWRAVAADARVRPWLVRLEWPVLILALICLANHIFAPILLRDEKPIDSADHQMLLFRVQLIKDALAHGRWDRWTHLLQGGDSVTDLYPFLFDLLVALVQGLSPFALKSTYTAAVVVTLMLRALAVFWLCRRFAGPLISGAMAAAALADSGVDIWDGGTHSAVFWGLMHSHLALTLALVALRCSADLLERVSGPRLVVGALAAGLAAVAHPIGMFVMCVWMAALALALLLRGTDPRLGGWALAAVAIGLALAAVVVLPAVRGLSEHGFSAAYPGLDFRGAGSVLIKGLQPSTTFGFAIGLGLLAVAAAATGRQVFLLATAITSLLLFAYLLAPLSVQTRLFDYLPSLAEGQPRRNTALLKLTALPAIAWLIALAFDQLGRVGSLRPRAVLGRGVVMALLLLGPARALWVGADEQSHAIGRAFDRPSEAVFGTRIAPDERAVFDWIAARRKEDPNPALWRVVVNWPRRWRHTLWSTGGRTGVPVVDFGWVSGNFLAYRPREMSEVGLRDWTVRYALTETGGPPVPGAKQVFHSGGIWVWEVPGYDGLSVVAPPGVQIEQLRFEPDQIRFVVKGAPPGGAPLRVRSAWFPAWRAWQNGERLPVAAQQPRPDAKPRQLQLGLVAGNGEVVLTCDGSMPGRTFGGLASLLGLAALVLVARARGRARVEALVTRAIARGKTAGRRLAGGWQELPRRRRWAAAGGAIALVAVAALGVRWSGGRRLRPAPWELSGLSAQASNGVTTRRCRASYWLGRSRCGDLGELDFYVGSDAQRDDTGEYVALFPGLRLTARGPGVTFRLRWRSLRLAGQQLQLRYFVGGAYRVRFRVAGVELPEQQWTGSGKPILALPAGLPRTGPVELQAEAIGAASLVLDGTLVPAPAR
jgi:hypothetical protein